MEGADADEARKRSSHTPCGSGTRRGGWAWLGCVLQRNLWFDKTHSSTKGGGIV